jgi:TfoX/Sxy family transcriptional regulator of competence genes
MAYDEELAGRIRVRLGGERDVSEKAMFGGLAFLVNGNMAVSVSGRGGLLVRVDPEDCDAVLALPHTELAVMRGRPMPGWVRVAGAAVEPDAELVGWIERGVGYARTLPPKR